MVGRHNREIAGELGISVRTVEVHKSRMMEKLQVDSIGAGPAAPAEPDHMTAAAATSPNSN